MEINTPLRPKIILLIFLAGIIVYLPAVSAPFIFDDNHMIVNNAFIKNFKYAFSFFKGYVTSYPIPKGMCRPLLMLTFSINYFMGTLNPTGYHIVNILFHLLNAILLYTLLNLLKRNIPSGLIIILTLLFAVHPLNTEAVTYISSRSDLMVTFFILSGFIMYLRNKYMTALFMYVLALLTKETALGFIIFISGYCLLYDKTSKVSSSHTQKNTFLLSALSVTIIYLLYYTTFYYGSLSKGAERSFISNALIQCWVSLFYLKLFIVPTPLNILHHYPNLTSLLQPEALVSFLGIAALIILMFALKGRRTLISLGLWWYIGWFIPRFLVRLDFPACEHHFYLPGIGIYTVLMGCLANLYFKNKKIVCLAGIGILFIFSLLSILRNYEYKDAPSFWRISVKRNPYSAYLHNELGRELLKERKSTEAEKEFNKAMNVAHRRVDVHTSKIMLSKVYLQRKEYNKARKILEELSKLATPPVGVNNSIGFIWMEEGEENKALYFWNREITLYPQTSVPYLHIGFHYLRKKELDKAESFFRKAVQKDPDFCPAYYGLGEIYEYKKGLLNALKYYREVISRKPDCLYLHYALGRLYMKAKNLTLACKELKKVIELDNNFAPAHNDLAVLYAHMIPPHWEEAKKHAYIADSLGAKVNKELMKLIEQNASEQ